MADRATLAVLQSADAAPCDTHLQFLIATPTFELHTPGLVMNCNGRVLLCVPLKINVVLQELLLLVDRVLLWLGVLNKQQLRSPGEGLEIVSIFSFLLYRRRCGFSLVMNVLSVSRFGQKRQPNVNVNVNVKKEGPYRRHVMGRLKVPNGGTVLKLDQLFPKHKQTDPK